MDRVTEELRRRVGRANQKEVAESLGISPQYICDILSGRREISAVIGRKLGFERVWKRVKKGGEE